MGLLPPLLIILGLASTCESFFDGVEKSVPQKYNRCVNFCARKAKLRDIKKGSRSNEYHIGCSWVCTGHYYPIIDMRPWRSSFSGNTGRSLPNRNFEKFKTGKSRTIPSEQKILTWRLLIIPVLNLSMPKGFSDQLSLGLGPVVSLADSAPLAEFSHAQTTCS
jgi:hypothetical protein